MRSPGRRSVITQIRAEVLVPGPAIAARSAFIGRVDDDLLARHKAGYAGADCIDHAAQFVPEDHGLTDHGVPDAPDMVIMKITPTNAHAAHAQTDETRLRLGDGALLNAEVFRTIQYACFHGAVPFKVPWFGRPAGGMRNARGWGGGDFVLSVLRIKRQFPPSASRSLATGNSLAGSRGRLPPCGVQRQRLCRGSRGGAPGVARDGVQL